MGRRSRVDLGQPASVEVNFERGERVDGAEGIACPTWCEFMEDSLHHPEWGYYSAARVVFGESSDAADFTTFPVSMRPAFGAMIADRLHGLWLAAGGGSGPFVVCELGAGTGVLAHDVLTHMADHLPRLYAVVQYVIAERSASLRSLQAATNERFVCESKLRVVCADARDLGGARLRQELQAAAAAHCASGGEGEVARVRGAVLSNELPDAFGVERALVGAALPRATAAEGSSAGAARPAELRLQRGRVLPLLRACLPPDLPSSPPLPLSASALLLSSYRHLVPLLLPHLKRGPPTTSQRGRDHIARGVAARSSQVLPCRRRRLPPDRRAERRAPPSVPRARSPLLLLARGPRR